MKREQESPNDRTQELGGPEALERLNEIERRLKTVRLRPPRLDVAALKRLAYKTTADAPVERPTSKVFRERLSERRWRPGQRIAVVAGSWAFGALVGALVMFAVMNRTEPGARSTKETAKLEKELPPSAPLDQDRATETVQRADQQEGSSDAKDAEPMDIDADVLAMILDPFQSGDSAYWAEGPTLQAGMHLGHHVGDSFGIVGRTTDTAKDFHPDEAPRRAEMQKKFKPYSGPKPPVTRERLMRDLLGGSAGSVL